MGPYGYVVGHSRWYTNHIQLKIAIHPPFDHSDIAPKMGARLLVFSPLTIGDGKGEGEFGEGNVRFPGEGDVSEEHVVEEDAQGPDGGRDGVVATVLHALGRAVHHRACAPQRERERGGGGGGGSSHKNADSTHQ